MSEMKFSQNKAKKTISKYAAKATMQIQQNNMLLTEIRQKTEEILESKKILQKLTQTNVNNIKKVIKDYNEVVQNKNIGLIKERQILREKRIKLIEASRETSELGDELRKSNEDNFLLVNAIFEKEAYINQLNNDTENFSKFVLFKEPRREIYEGDPLEIEKEFLCELTCCQELLLSRCRNYNKLMTKKKTLKDMIYSMKGMTRNKLPSFGNIPDNYLSTKEKENEIEFTENNESEFIDDICSDSEDEIQFDDRVDNKNCLRGQAKIEEQIPKIDLKQIEFNKRKVKPGEETEVKLSRRNDDSSIERKVHTLRGKIKVSKSKIKKKIEKIKLLESKIESMNKRLLSSESGNVNTNSNTKTSGNYSATYIMKLSPIKEEFA